MRTTRSWMAVAAALALMGWNTGCPDESSGDDDDDNGNQAPTDTYLIEGYFGGLAMPGGFGMYVGRIDPDDPSAANCDVTLNGDNVDLRPLLSDANDAFYAILAYDYVPNAPYEIEVSLGGVSASCSFTGPEFPWLTLEQPTADTFDAGDPIGLVWSYDEGTPETVHITVTGGYDSEVLLEEQLPGSDTSYTIAGNTTASWGGYSDILITVDLGGELWPFIGDLASAGSFVATIFSGDSALLYPN